MEFGLAIGGALASSALPVLLEQVKAKLKKPLPVKNDVQDLERLLGFISAAIKDHYGPDGKGVVSHVRDEWIKNLKLLAYEIEDCTERFLHRVMSDGAETGDTSRDFATEIAKLKRESNDIHEHFLKYDTQAGGIRPPRVMVTAPASGAQPWCAPPEGMGKPIEELQNLVREAEWDKRLKVISLLGLGGLGKTLLARNVYAAEKSKFALHAWVRADGKGPCQLLQEILHQVEKQLADTSADTDNAPKYSIWSRMGKATPVPQVDAKGKGIKMENDVHDVRTKLEQIKERLVLCLKDRRYLIVLIDMRETSQWLGIDAFPKTTDSRIIVTTTKHAVAKFCSDIGGKVYEMSTLSDEDSRKLLFHSRNEPSSPVRPETSQIVAKCGGLPLALISTRHLLAGKTIDAASIGKAFSQICGPEKPKAVATAESEEEDERDPEERMRQVLLSTYEGLPSHFVQVCLLYFSMYPGHRVIRRDSLIRKWLAEGLAHTGDGDAVENLDALIDRCIIQSTGVSTSGNMEGCKVPGMVLEYVTRYSSSQDFVRVWDGSQTDELKDVRRLSLHPNPSSNSQWTLPKVADPKVRTLAVFSNKEGEATTTLSNKEAIAGYKLMRVLDLEGCGGLENSDFQQICCNLLLLKYLSLGGSISKVPSDIENLQLLETLDLRNTKIDLVPIQVIKLPQMKHLLGKFQLSEGNIFRKRDLIRKNKMVRGELEKFLSDDCKLEMLSGFVIDMGQGFPQLLSHMKKLKKLKIWCKSTAHDINLNAVSQGIHKFLCGAGANARSLSIDFSGCGKEFSSKFLGSLAAPAPAASLNTATPSSTATATKGKTLKQKIFSSSVNQKSLTTSFSEPKSLYSLSLYGKLNGFPVFITELSSITELCLYWTNLTPEVMQGGLNRLKNPTLKYLKLVEHEVGPLVIQTKYFTGLERICLVGRKRMNMITIQDKALPLLRSLHILCEGLDGLSGIQINSLPSLKEVGLHSGGTGVTKGKWEAEAMKHCNWPNLVLIDQEESEDVGMTSK